MKRALLLAACFAAAFSFGYFLSGHVIAKYVDPWSFVLVTAYTVILVLARYSPGRCAYRMLVLASPRKHLPSELVKAAGFVDFVAARLLFAGLIFTLVQIARALAGLDGGVTPGALASTLTAALYALVLYAVVRRISPAAAPWAGMARLPVTAG